MFSKTKFRSFWDAPIDFIFFFKKEAFLFYVTPDLSLRMLSRRSKDYCNAVKKDAGVPGNATPPCSLKVTYDLVLQVRSLNLKLLYCLNSFYGAPGESCRGGRNRFAGHHFLHGKMSMLPGNFIRTVRIIINGAMINELAVFVK